MAEVTIDGRTWVLGPSLGSGGFGRVFAATSNGEQGAVKLVPKDPGAQRELLLAGDLTGVPNIVPVNGVGDTGTDWSILMPRAEKSLRAFLREVGRPLDQSEAVPVLLDIAQSLVSLSTKTVVHRDLKPDNVLLLNGHWCLTDFGISRYADATTAIDTRKYFKTAAYAAPEQWREERTTSATDVYAFGIMAFEMLTGKLPFAGPNFRDQHLHHAPDSLSADVDSPLRSLIDECLTKAPQARPAPARLVARLQVQADAEAPTGGMASLVEAHLQQVGRVSEDARRASAARSEADRRADLFAAATATYERIRTKLRDFVQSGAPSVEGAWPLRLGAATLQMTAPAPSTSTGRMPFDVIAHAEIQIDQSRVGGGAYRGRAHSLWFCDAREAGQYAWFETAFMAHPLMPQAVRTLNPFSAVPVDDVAQQSLGPGMGTYQVAWPFTALVDDDLTDFVNRWATLLADASAGRLREPSQMPERQPHGSWRQG